MMSLARISAFFPSFGIRGGPARSMKALRIDAARYNSMGACIGLSAGAGAFILASGSALALPIALLSCAAAYGLVLALPLLEAGKRKAEMEACMPLFLRSAGMFIGMGMPFRRALEMACSDDALGAEIRAALRGADGGIGLQKALGGIALAHDSALLKRAVAQLIMAYETGASGKEVMKIGDDMMQAESGRMREYSARSAVFGLLFMMASAIFPTFFIVYSIASGASGGNAMMDPWRMRLAMLAVFPLVSALVLMLSKASMPRTSLGSGEGLELAMLAPGLLLAGGFVFFPEYDAILLPLSAAVGVWLAAGHYIRERRVEEIERSLPDALLSVCGMPGSSGPERIFALIEEGGFGALSEEAGKSRRQVGMNNRLDAVLDDLWRRNRSPLLRRAALMLGAMVATHSLERIGTLADDMLRSFQLVRERRALFAMQKYTLIAGALLVPLILGMTIGLMDGISGMDGRAAGAAALVPPYLVIYSVMAAAAISDGEGRKSSAAIYSVGLSACSLLAFHFINS